MPPENIRKPLIFLHFQGVEKWDIGWIWINEKNPEIGQTAFTLSTQ